MTVVTKLEFILALNERLSGLPKSEIPERLEFYSEMIDDRIDEGLSEEEAVADVGNVEDIATQIIAETPLIKIAKEKLKPKRRLRAWEITLLAVGFPLWFPLLIVAFAVMLSLYVVLWSVIISLWSVFASLVGCAFGGIVGGTCIAIFTNPLTGIALIGAAFVCAGLSIFAFYGCKAATRGLLLLTKKAAIGIKSSFMKKEEA